MRGPHADPGQGDAARHEAGQRLAGTEIEPAIDHGLRNRTHGGRAGARQPDGFQGCLGQHLRGGELAVQSLRHALQGGAEAVHHPACQRGGCSDADLLAQHRAHGHFKAIPAAGHAQPGALCDTRRQQWLLRERRVHHAQVGIEIEDAAHAAHDARNRTRIDLAQVQQQLRTPWIGGHAQQ
ncbi:hypothetical protein D3C71_1605240 [compost metagenome]